MFTTIGSPAGPKGLTEDVSSENLVVFKDIRVAELEQEQWLGTKLTTGIVERGMCRRGFKQNEKLPLSDSHR